MRHALWLFLAASIAQADPVPTGRFGTAWGAIAGQAGYGMLSNGGGNRFQGAVAFLAGSDGVVSSYGTRIGFDFDGSVGLGTTFDAGDHMETSAGGETSLALRWMLRAQARIKASVLHFSIGDTAIRLGLDAGLSIDLDGAEPWLPAGAWVVGGHLTIGGPDVWLNLLYVWTPRQGDSLVLKHSFAAQARFGGFFLGLGWQRELFSSQVDQFALQLGATF